MSKNKTSDLESKLIEEATTIVKNDKKVLTLTFLQDAYDVYFSYVNDNEVVDESSRYSSWDICYNFFQRTKKDSDLRIAGLYLGFYLASWGMFRNPRLLNSGIKEYELLAGKLYDLKGESSPNAQYEKLQKVKVIDSEENDCSEENDRTETLVTKMMLGAYSNTPAFDRFFRKTVSRFYGKWEKNLTLEEKIERIFSIKTEGEKSTLRDFIKEKSRSPEDKICPKDIKILDAIFFQIGSALDKAEKELNSVK